jgi:phage tail-like protein
MTSMSDAALNDLPSPRRVPPLAAPPHDPYSLLLGGWIGPDPAIGWRVRRLRDAEIGAGSQALVLSPAPGAERSAGEPSGSFGGLRPPINVAFGPQGEVLLLDPVSGRLLRFDPCCCEFKALPCTTRAVQEAGDACALPAPQRPRRVPLDQLRDATGLAACGSVLSIADGGHQRIVRWDLQALVPRGELRLPAAERARLAYAWTPGSLAFDGHGRLHAADALNRRIDRFDARGVWQRRFTTPRPVWHIAIDCRDRLHAVLMEASGLWPAAGAGDSALWQWQAPGPTAPAVLRWDTDEAAPVTLALRSDRLEDFACPPLAIDAAGRLHLPCGDEGAGAAAASCDGQAAGAAPLFDARGQRVRAEGQVLAPRYRRRGRYLSQSLDSEIDDCTWHRVELRGCIPSGCSVTLRTLTADILLTQAELDDLGDDAWSVPVVATAMAAGRWDALVRSQPGRHAWLSLELAGDGFETPHLDAALVEYPRISLRRYLPAVFGMEPASADFTDRFTAIFDASLRSIESRLDRQAALFDPLSAPAEGLDGHADFLDWLASWIGVALARDWPESRRRQYLKSAARWYPQRGTPAGLRGQLLLLLGLDRAAEGCSDERPAPRRHCLPRHPAPRCVPLPLNCRPAPARLPAEPPQLLLEHFKLRRWLFAGRARLGDDSVLWGERIVNRSQLGAAPAPEAPQACGPGNVDPLAVAGTRGSARAGHSQLIGTPDPLRDPLLVHANRISVFVPACVRDRPADERALRQLLATEVPAHVQVDLQHVEPRFRVGIQAMVGLDSVIARTPQGVALGSSTLGAGTVLPADPGGAPKAGRMRVGGATPLA